MQFHIKIIRVFIKAKLYSQMPSFISKQLIIGIIKELGFIGQVDLDEIQLIRTFMQLEAHHLFQSSAKFMRNDKRQIIGAQDVVMACKDSGHDELFLSQNYHHSNSEDHLIDAHNGEFQSQALKELENLQILKSKLQGKWIYLKGKIPALTHNIDLKCLSQQIQGEKLESNESKQLFSIIKDNPYSLLTNDQFQYFEKMCFSMLQNVKPDGNFTVSGDLNSLLPFFLKFLGQSQMNETSVCFLIKLIENKYIWMAIQYNLKKILNLLLAYRGVYSFEVGNKIAQLVKRFSDKYPILRDIYTRYADKSYSTILKKISYELIIGTRLQVDDGFWEQCQSDCQNNNQMAILCMNTLKTYSSQLFYTKQLFKKKMHCSIYWHPCHELKSDPYLHMF